MKTSEITILKAVETVHQVSKESKLDINKYNSVLLELKYISSYFEINEVQSILLASFISLSCFDEIE